MIKLMRRCRETGNAGGEATRQHEAAAAEHACGRGLRQSWRRSRTRWTSSRPVSRNQGITVALHAAEQEHPDVAAAPVAWRERQPSLNPARLVFIYETWAATNMVRRYGRAPTAACASLPPCRTATGRPATFWLPCATTRSRRPALSTAPPMARSSAPMSSNFSSRPSRQRISSSWPILPHTRSRACAKAIEAAGPELFYLPPYSPDLNPIEQAFAKPKALLRAAAARTIDKLWATIGRSLNAFSRDECANYFANDRYAPINRNAL